MTRTLKVYELIFTLGLIEEQKLINYLIRLDQSLVAKYGGVEDSHATGNPTISDEKRKKRIKTKSLSLSLMRPCAICIYCTCYVCKVLYSFTCMYSYVLYPKSKSSSLSHTFPQLFDHVSGNY